MGMKTALRSSNTASILVLLTLYVCGTSVTASSQQLPDTIDRVRPSIVQVSKECVYANNLTSTNGGTAFLISPEGFALTAAHVVAKCASVLLAAQIPPNLRPAGVSQMALLSQSMKIGLPLVYSVTDQNQKRGNFTLVDADVIERDDVHDVALLKLSRNPFGAEIQSGYTLEGKPLRLMPLGVALLSSRTLREGEPIAVSGFPFESSVLVTNAGIIASTRKAHYFDTGDAAVHVRVTSDFYLADMTVNHGNSGGPVYDASGEVIGIVSEFDVAEIEQFVGNAWQQTRRDEGAHGYNSRLAVIVPISNATALMAKRAIRLPSH
jgi:S1-C subfamily serine protease